MIPYAHYEIRQVDGKGTGQLNGVGSSERVNTCKFSRVTLDCSGEFHWLDCRPESLPVPLNLSGETIINSVISCGSSERGANFGIGEATRQRTVAPIPESGGEIATLLMDDELHQRTGVEVHERHSWLVALLSDEVSYRRGASNSSMSTSVRSRSTVSSTDDTFGAESFQEGRGVHTKKASNWNTAIGDENLLTRIGTTDPFAEMGSQVADSYVHLSIVQ